MCSYYIKYVSILAAIIVGELVQCQECNVEYKIHSNCTKACYPISQSYWKCNATLFEALSYPFTTEPCNYNYNLPPGDQEMDFTAFPFSNINAILVTFSGQESHIICTEDNTGFVFDGVSVSMNDITFSNCSSSRQSTTRNFVSNTTYNISVALYFSNCVNIILESISVNVMRSVTGVVMYNPRSVSVTDSNFSASHYDAFENLPDWSVSHVGGGFVLELTYCQPGDFACNIAFISSNSASYNFVNCRFIDNSAVSVATSSDSNMSPGRSVPTGFEFNSFGKGGGLSIIIKKDAYAIKIKITDCSFVNNRAELHGGGLFISYLDQTYYNSVSIMNTVFEGNHCPLTRSSGGGIHVENLVNGYQNNIFSLWQYNSFSNNSAYIGGGIAFISTNDQFFSTPNCDDLCGIHYTNYTSNVATFGAAVHIHQLELYKLQQQLPSTPLILKACRFNNNYKIYPITANRITQSGMGAVYSIQNDIWFQEEVTFIGNSGSGLVIVDAIANFTDSRATFISNTGLRGGAVALLDNSHIEINERTSMQFTNNSALYKGGAIYIQFIEQIGALLHVNDHCFIKHSDASLNPDYWRANFSFAGNKIVDDSNAIHSTSILPCTIQGSNGGKPLCWKGWKYDDDTTCNITGHVTTDSNDENSLLTTSDLEAFPGLPFKLPLILKDDLNQDIIADTVSFVLTAQNKTLVSSKENLYVIGQVGNRVEATLESLGDHPLHFKLNISLQVCPPGFVNGNINSTKDGEKRCICPKQKAYDGLVTCNESLKIAVIMANYWMGLVDDGYDNHHDYYVAPCPKHFCSLKRNSFHILPNSPNTLNDVICEKHRKGVLCGECESGYCLAVNTWTFDCVYYNDTDGDVDVGSSVVQFVAAVYLPLAIILVLISVFHVKLTVGSLNGFVLFAQMITTTFELTNHGAIPLERRLTFFPYTYRFLYGPFNMEFLEKFIKGFCFSHSFNALSVLLLDYLLLIIPVTGIIVIASSVLLSRRFSERKTLFFPNNICGQYHNMTKYFSGFSKTLSETFTMLMSTLMLLSYTKISNASAQILGLRHLSSISGTNHIHRVYLAGQLASDDHGYAYYKVVAILGQGYLLLLILLLLDYPLRLLEIVVRKKKSLYRLYPLNAIHSFTGCFQDYFLTQYRFFAGFYFIFRYAVGIVHVLSNSSIRKYIIQELSCIIMLLLLVLCKPYKKNVHNYMDTFIFANLAVINALTFFQHDYFQLTAKSNASCFVFILQYALTLTPIVVIIVTIALRYTKNHIKKCLFRLLARRGGIELGNRFINNAMNEDSELELSTDNNPSNAEDKSMQQPGRKLNGLEVGSGNTNEAVTGASVNGGIPVTIVNVFDKDMGEAATIQTSVSEGYYLKTEWNSGRDSLYGSIEGHGRQKKRK